MAGSAPGPHCSAIAHAQGRVVRSLQVPNVPPLRYLGIWFRGIDAAAVLLQASSVVVGVVR